MRDNQMRSSEMTPAAIRRIGTDALIRALGPVGAIRFLQQFDPGEGDYTRDREQLFDGVELDDILESIRERRGRERAT